MCEGGLRVSTPRNGNVNATLSTLLKQRQVGTTELHPFLLFCGAASMYMLSSQGLIGVVRLPTQQRYIL